MQKPKPNHTSVECELQNDFPRRLGGFSSRGKRFVARGMDLELLTKPSVLYLENHSNVF